VSGRVWPYRPRRGYPSAPSWLIVILLFVAIILALILFASLGVNGNPDDRYGPF
jgi:hypothetical protein